MKKNKLMVGLILISALVTAVLLGRQWHSSQVSEAPSAKARTKGNSNAPIVMEVYSDFQCPACRNAIPAIEALREQFPDQTQVIFRHFPLEQHHHWALLAAQFSECAGAQGKFWEFHDRTYAEQDNWSKATDALPNFISYVRDMNLNLEELQACVTREDVVDRIRKERETGSKRGVRSTPTIFINDKPLVGGPQLSEKGAEVIQQELATPGTEP